MRRSLSRHERVRSPKEIAMIFRRGTTVSTRGMRLVYALNGLPYTRVVVVPARGFRTAVARNRCRRQTKEAFREMKDRVTKGYDVAIVTYPGTGDYRIRQSQLSGLLMRAGILHPRSSKEN